MIGRRSHDDAQSFEAALTGERPRDGHIADLVRFAESICEAAAVEPSTSFRDSLRAQLMNEAGTVLVPVAPTPRRAPPAPRSAKRFRRRAASLTAAAVTAVGVVGIVASSASAVPGELLYPVKRTVENVELQLHRDDASRGAFQLSRASERLAEARQLSAENQSVSLISDTLDDFSASATDGSGMLFTEFGETGEEKTIRQVNDFAASSSLDLTSLSAQLPDEVSASFDAAKQAVTNLASEASSLCGACVPADVDALLTAVTDAVKDTPAAKDDTTADPKRDEPAPPTTTTTATPAPAAQPAPAGPTATQRPAATPAPTIPAPAVPAPTRTPSLTDLTDPLIGGLLGDDDQEGLVPGLLNGLLGTTPAPPTPAP